jgi:hypothetical protein
MWIYTSTSHILHGVDLIYLSSGTTLDYTSLYLRTQITNSASLSPRTNYID